MLLPHFFGWSEKQLRNFCALQTTLLRLPYSLLSSSPFAPHMEEQIFCSKERQRRRRRRRWGRRNEKQHLKAWKENMKSKENYDKKQQTHTHTHSRIFWNSPNEWLEDARVSSFIMHTCVYVYLFCFFSLIQILLPGSFYARWVQMGFQIDCFIRDMSGCVSVWVSIPCFIFQRFDYTLYLNLRRILKATPNETAKKRRKKNKSH